MEKIIAFHATSGCDSQTNEIRVASANKWLEEHPNVKITNKYTNMTYLKQYERQGILTIVIWYEINKD